MGFHLDQKDKGKEIIKFQKAVEIIQQRYSNSDVIIFADLNIGSKSKKILTLKEDLLKQNVNMYVPQNATRRGYTNQKDSVIDYMLYNNKVARENKIDFKIISGKGISDHNPLQISIEFKEPIRKFQKNSI